MRDPRKPILPHFQSLVLCLAFSPGMPSYVTYVKHLKNSMKETERKETATDRDT